MQIRLAILALVLLLLGCDPGSRKQSEVACSTQQADGILRLEWRVGVMTHGGSAFVLRHGNKDYVVTAAHSVSDRAGKLHLMDASGTPVPFIVKRRIDREGVDATLFEVDLLPASVKRFQALPIKSGMSGGPLLSGDKVVGVVSSRVLRSDGVEFSNYADMADVVGMIE